MCITNCLKVEACRNPDLGRGFGQVVAKSDYLKLIQDLESRDIKSALSWIERDERFIEVVFGDFATFMFITTVLVCEGIIFAEPNIAKLKVVHSGGRPPPPTFDGSEFPIAA